MAKKRRRARTARPQRSRRARIGGIVVIPSGDVRQARERVRVRHGSELASKATDALVLAMAAPASRRLRENVAFAASVRGPVTRRPGAAAIVELKPAIVSPDRPIGEAPGRDRSLREAARHVDRETPDRRVGGPDIIRQTRVAPLRDEFYKSIAPLGAAVGKRLVRVSLRESRPPEPAMDVCWLNQTLRMVMSPDALAEIAPDRRVELVDLPRRLVREMDVCGVTVGAPVFRTRTRHDGTGIVVAVIDGEVDAEHLALTGRVMHKRNFTREPFGFADGHGTAVAGIIGARDPRFSGVAPGVSILNYKVFATDPRLDGDDFDAALAIQQALEDGAHVANCSWGAGPAGTGTGREARACDRAWGLGLVLVKSAGNNGPRARTLTTPADADGIIVVGATDRQGKAVQSYSSRGPAGTRNRPHLVAPGGSDDEGIQTCQPGGGFADAGSGTSFAAPQVSGLAALLLDDDPNLAPDDVRNSLVRASTKLARGNAATQGVGIVRLK